VAKTVRKAQKEGHINQQQDVLLDFFQVFTYLCYTSLIERKANNGYSAIGQNYTDLCYAWISNIMFTPTHKKSKKKNQKTV
jgi:hypothetical protein